MIVKNIFVVNINMFIEEIVKELIKNDFNYLLIKNDNYVELYFDKYIYNMYFNKNLVKGNSDSINNSFLDMELNSFNPNSSASYYKKERPGFKRYTKKDIKKGNGKYKV